MAGKRIYVEFVDAPARARVRGVCDLYWENAPVTCGIIWKALATPIRVTGFHAMFAGPEVMTGLPPAAQKKFGVDPRKIPAENQTCFPGAGELLWFYQGKNVMKGLTDELWEIGVFYDNGGRTFGPLGWTPCNIFGIMNTNLAAFAERCRDIRLTGAKTLEFGRA